MHFTINNMCRSLWQITIPDPCWLCQGPKCTQEFFLCTPCFLGLPRELNLRDQCPLLIRKFWGLLPISRTYAYLKFAKGNSVQQLLHALKYHHLPSLGFALGKWFAAEILKQTAPFDLIVPVPLHARRQRQRGYNQSMEIARGISDSTGWKLYPCLYRAMAASTQTGLSRWQRYDNTQNQFGLCSSKSVANAEILLLDDVVTTGATTTACARILIQAGARVSIAAVALAQDQ